MLNIKKVKGILKAQQGLQIPSSLIPNAHQDWQNRLNTKYFNPSFTSSALEASSNMFQPIATIQEDQMQNKGLQMLQNGVQGVKGFVSNIMPVAKVATTAFSLANTLGASPVEQFSYNKDTAEQIGGSYGGAMNTLNTAEDLTGKNIGMFNFGQRNKAKRARRRALEIQPLMDRIAKQSYDQHAAVNDLLPQQYQQQINGGIDLRAYKEGGELTQWSPIIKIKEISWKPTICFKQGGKTEELEAPKIEETSQKNIIPEGALHKNKHHMDNDDNITKKGIPVIDDKGNQQAEIELNEIIFTLEVTKKLEELYNKYYNESTSQKDKDKCAIEAGQLLVKEILFNTEDRTGLIDTLKQGGKIDELK